MLLTSSHFKPVVGIDNHEIKSKPGMGPVPLPYIGIVIDIFDYLPFVGATVSVNGFKRGTSGTGGRILTIVHLPHISRAEVEHDSFNFFGSLTVSADEEALAPAGYSVVTCSDFGIPLSAAPTKGSWKPGKSYYLPSSSSIPVSYGSPVLVGGPYVPDVKVMATNLLMGTGMAYGSRFLSKFFFKPVKKQAKQIWGKLTKATRSVKCEGDPVDAVSGRVFYPYTDFELKSPFPIRWERVWHSDSDYQGPLGHGTHHSYDIQMHAGEEDGGIAVLLGDGRQIMFDHIGFAGGEAHNKGEQMGLLRTFEGYVLSDRNTGVLYRFELFGSNLYRPVELVNGLGHRISLRYERGHLVELTDCTGKRLELRLDSANRIVEIEALSGDKRRKLVSYSYNTSGDLEEIRDALDRPTVIYYESHLMIKKTDRKGESYHWRYDSKNRCVHTHGEGGLLTGNFEYHTDHTVFRDGLGNQKRYFFDNQGRYTKMVDALGFTRETHYTEDSQILREIDELGGITGYVYNHLGLLTDIVYPDGSEEHMMYDDDGRILVHTDRGGNSHLYSYDEYSGQLKNEILGDGSVMERSYGDEGLLMSTSENGAVSQFHYDESLNLNRVDLPDGGALRWVYDAWGQCITFIGADGSYTTYSYDAMGDMVCQRLPTGATAELSYTPYHDVTSIKLGHREVTFSYLSVGVASKRTENGKTTHYHYNRNLELTGLENPNGDRYEFELDARGYVVSEKSFDGLTTRYIRNGKGDIVQAHRSNGCYSRYSYSPMGELLRSEHSDGSWEVYEYDPLGMMIGAYNRHHTLRWKRDRFGRVEEEWQDNHCIRSIHGKFGRTQVRSSLGAHIEQGYNGLGLLDKVIAFYGLGESWAAQIGYETFGRESTRSYSGEVHVNWAYGSNGLPIEQRIHRSGILQQHWGLSWNGSGNLTEVRNMLNGGYRSYSYQEGFLTGTVDYKGLGGREHHYSRDLEGNMYASKERSDRRYSSGGRLDAMGESRYGYDAVGNLDYEDTPQGRTVYRWNHNGSLREVADSSHKKTIFEYDALGRRTAKICGGKICRYLWDGNTLLHEWSYDLVDRPVSVVDEIGYVGLDRAEPLDNPITWVYREGSFEPMARLDSTGAYSIICDHAGTPVLAYSNLGEKVWTRQLEAYGKLKEETGPSNFVPHTFMGQYLDAETGLSYNRFRYYNSEIGQYISKDPIGLAGGNPTLYGYVYDSNTQVDVFGLEYKLTTKNQFIYQILGLPVQMNAVEYITHYRMLPANYAIPIGNPNAPILNGFYHRSDISMRSLISNGLKRRMAYDNVDANTNSGYALIESERAMGLVNNDHTRYARVDIENSMVRDAYPISETEFNNFGPLGNAVQINNAPTTSTGDILKFNTVYKGYAYPGQPQGTTTSQYLFANRVNRQPGADPLKFDYKSIESLQEAMRNALQVSEPTGLDHIRVAQTRVSVRTYRNAQYKKLVFDNNNTLIDAMPITAAEYNALKQAAPAAQVPGNAGQNVNALNNQVNNVQLPGNAGSNTNALNNPVNNVQLPGNTGPNTNAFNNNTNALSNQVANHQLNNNQINQAFDDFSSIENIDINNAGLTKEQLDVVNSLGSDMFTGPLSLNQTQLNNVTQPSTSAQVNLGGKKRPLSPSNTGGTSSKQPGLSVPSINTQTSQMSTGQLPYNQHHLNNVTQPSTSLQAGLGNNQLNNQGGSFSTGNSYGWQGQTPVNPNQLNNVTQPSTSLHAGFGNNQLNNQGGSFSTGNSYGWQGQTPVNPNQLNNLTQPSTSLHAGFGNNQLNNQGGSFSTGNSYGWQGQTPVNPNQLNNVTQPSTSLHAGFGNNQLNNMHPGGGYSANNLYGGQYNLLPYNQNQVNQLNNVTQPSINLQAGLGNDQLNNQGGSFSTGNSYGWQGQAPANTNQLNNVTQPSTNLQAGLGTNQLNNQGGSFSTGNSYGWQGQAPVNPNQLNNVTQPSTNLQAGLGNNQLNNQGGSFSTGNSYGWQGQAPVNPNQLNNVTPFAPNLNAHGWNNTVGGQNNGAPSLPYNQSRFSNLPQTSRSANADDKDSNV